jgi:hypothetical protein
LVAGLARSCDLEDEERRGVVDVGLLDVGGGGWRLLMSG